ncbi:peptide ABC transporter substrate-binding protein [Elstera cyanobacteriorum]|uniref:Peptide ABC transporter substrate-binding protein n=1 Tax=Elstera cyanobacteriorum TaxID=2022747 RepID=A0A255XXS6_9PROT|nr:ABC transporter substrate-binding protein [Elstera cyanobacteriorum]OYQ21722.1 peptide ABC transporter substrate-binding protein [Elstera cyanobacteriorum]GGA01338.1 peptide ABC transporter substrate-binding protein [Elstera cyanobacteriorum]
MQKLAFVTLLMAGTALAFPASAVSFKMARGQDATTMDPHAQNSGQNFNLLHQIYEPLVHRDNDAKLTPALATAWKITADPTVWEFKLRPGVKFHNGNSFNADDVVFSLTRAMGDKSQMKGLLTSIEQVTKVDDLTVNVKTKGPNPLLVNDLTNLFMMDKEWSEANNVVNSQDFNAKEETYAVRNTNGTGPYVLKVREPDVRSVLAANPAYWGKGQFPLKVSEITYSVIAAAPTRVAALLSGEVDFVQDVPVQDIARIAGTNGMRVNSGAENRSIFFSLNTGDADLKFDTVEGKNPLADLRVRQAIDFAINRSAIQKVVMSGQSTPSGTLLPPGSDGYTKELDAITPYDLNKAKALMKDAGYEAGFGITMHCPNNRYVNDEKICQAVVGMLGQIGIKVTLEARPMAQHSPQIIEGAIDFYLLGWGVPTFDGEYVLKFLYHSREGKGAYGSYNPKYSNAELDGMIKSLATETDKAKRDATMAKALKIAKDSLVHIPVHNQNIAWAMKANYNIPVQTENTFFIKYVDVK